MGFLDRLFGRSDERDSSSRDTGYRDAGPQDRTTWVPGSSPGRGADDERAIARYRYLLETAPPDKIEQAHAEAFAQLTSDERRQVLDWLAQAGDERPADDSPRSLARNATRLERRRPGSLMSAFGGGRYGTAPGARHRRSSARLRRRGLHRHLHRSGTLRSGRVPRRGHRWRRAGGRG